MYTRTTNTISGMAPRFVKVPNSAVDMALHNYLWGRLYLHPFQGGDVLPRPLSRSPSAPATLAEYRTSRYRESLYRMLGTMCDATNFLNRGMLWSEIRNRNKCLSRLTVDLIPSVASNVRESFLFSFLVNDCVLMRAWLPSFVPSSMNHTAIASGVNKRSMFRGMIFRSFR